MEVTEVSPIYAKYVTEALFNQANSAIVTLFF